MTKRLLIVMVAAILLSSCGGGKGCGPTYDPGLVRTVHRDYFYVDLGEFTPERLNDGVIVAQGALNDEQKQRLARFIDDARKQDGYRTDQFHYIHLIAYLEHEDHLRRDFVYGDELYDYEQYFCSDLRLFIEPSSYFTSVEPGQPVAFGTMGTFRNWKDAYEKRLNSTRSEHHNPSSVILANVPSVGVTDKEFYKGEFKIRFEAGTSITAQNMPSGKFFVRFYLRMSTVQGSQASLNDAPASTPKCGPYKNQMMDMSKDFGSDMNPSDMSQVDMISDMADMIDSVSDMDASSDQTPDQADLLDSGMD